MPGWHLHEIRSLDSFHVPDGRSPQPVQWHRSHYLHTSLTPESYPGEWTAPVLPEKYVHYDPHEDRLPQILKTPEMPEADKPMHVRS